MRRGDFHYSLPEELIAQQPAPEREASRLLCLDRDSGAVADREFRDLPSLLKAGDLLVFNDTRVIPARLYGRKASGGRAEILVERVRGEDVLLAQVRASKSPGTGTRIILEGGDELEVAAREDAFFVLQVKAGRPVRQLLEESGHVPLPPYIRREDTTADRDRYQTVFARRPGAVAAPTAGLHFTDGMLARLRDAGVETGFCTLHVGAGTFQPLRVDEIEDHRMHVEWCEVSEELCERIRAARARHGRVVAAGTTVVRSLEAAAAGGTLRPFRGETGIFIYPGFEFRVVDAVITNFHLPESTLLMLVCAFAGREHILRAYEHAIRERYRFFSYGDAMFIG